MNKIIKLKSIKRLEFSHSTADGKPEILKYHLESRGTQVFLTLLLPALHALSEGSVLVIDELDTSLHPDLSRSLLSLFYRKISNPQGFPKALAGPKEIFQPFPGLFMQLCQVCQS